MAAVLSLSSRAELIALRISGRGGALFQRCPYILPGLSVQSVD